MIWLKVKSFPRKLVHVIKGGPATPVQRKLIREISAELVPETGGGYVPWWTTRSEAQYEVDRLHRIDEELYIKYLREVRGTQPLRRKHN